MSSANSEKQLVTRYVKNNKQMFHTSHIPGQVNLSPPKTETLYKKVSIDQNTGSDLIVEDLELLLLDATLSLDNCLLANNGDVSSACLEFFSEKPFPLYGLLLSLFLLCKSVISIGCEVELT
jgi:hypothetical protein